VTGLYAIVKTASMETDANTVRKCSKY